MPCKASTAATSAIALPVRRRKAKGSRRREAVSFSSLHFTTASYLPFERFTAVPLALPRWIRLRSSTSLWLATAGLVVLSDWLVWDRPLGCSAALLTMGLLLVLLLRRPTILRHRPPLLLLIALAGLVAGMLLEPTPLVLAYAAVLLLWLIIFAQSRRVAGAGVWIQQAMLQVLQTPVRWILDLQIARRWLRRHPTSSRWSLLSLRLWVLPLVLGATFVGLFAIANPVIGRWISTASRVIFDLLEQIPFLLDALRIGFWFVVALTAWMLLRARPVVMLPPRLRHRAPAATVHGIATPPPTALPAPAGRATTTTAIVVRCLFVFNAIFAVQNALDARYLLAGGALPEGMSYAEYAHRGAYPLVAAALLAGLFVLVTFRPGAASERSTAARWLVYAWLGQTVLLTVAAVWRLDLYVSIYSLSRLRLAAGIWMALVAAGLLWIGLRIVLGRTNAWLIHANALTAGVVLYACCFFDIDGFIAAYNVRHARDMGGAGVAVDLPYLRSLGPEALPALRTLAGGANDQRTRESAQSAVASLERELAVQLEDWRGWTLRRARLANQANIPAMASAPSPMAAAGH
jgi:hypothetical protein